MYRSIASLCAWCAMFAFGLAAHATATQPHDNIYRYHGLKVVTTGPSTDGIYQDFVKDNDNVGKMWGDADALTHGGQRPSWVRSYVVRSEEPPYLRVEFSREGYGVNISITPKARYPEVVPSDGYLYFELRAATPVCVGVRLMERDGEVWGHGSAPLHYDLQCVDASAGWKHVAIPLTDPGSWFRFEYSGNVDLGNRQFDADIIAGVSLELGTRGDGYLGTGTASLDVRDLHVRTSGSPYHVGTHAVSSHSGGHHP